MPEATVDSRYIALKLIQQLYEQGKINRKTYECVLQTYAPSAGSAAH